MKFSVAIACGGHEHMLVACVRSVRARCDRSVPVHVCFDGFEPDAETLAVLAELGVGHTTFPENRGISAAWNAAARACIAAGGDLVFVLNDDTEVHDGVDTLYLDFFERNPHVQVACSLDRLTGWSLIPEIQARHEKAWGFDKLQPNTTLASPGIGIYGSQGYRHYAEWVRGLPHPEFLRCRMNGAAMVWRAAALEEIGFFDEGYRAPGTHEDIHAYMQVLSKHGPDAMGTLTRSFVHHIRAATISNYPRDWAEARVAENSRRFAKAWRTPEHEPLWQWLCVVNALPVGGVEPAFPGGIT